MPVKELATALGVSEGAAMRLRKAVRGLVEAAIEWFMTVSEDLEEFGWTKMKMDPCARALYGDAHGQDIVSLRRRCGPSWTPRSWTG
eukprot:514207-Pyramimonas_sp.AAC.1